MEIEYKDDITVAFEYIPIGEVFAYNDKIYIKTDIISVNTAKIINSSFTKTNAINAKTGEHLYFENTDTVKWLKHAKLTMGG